MSYESISADVHCLQGQRVVAGHGLTAPPATMQQLQQLEILAQARAMKHNSGPFRLVHKLNARGDAVFAADIYSGSIRIGTATIRDDLQWQGNGKLFAMSAEMHKALRIIHTWASVPGALDAENVLNLINPVLAHETDDPTHE